MELRHPQGMELRHPQGMELRHPQGMELRHPQGMELRHPQGMELRHPQGMELRHPEGFSLKDLPATPATEVSYYAQKGDPSLYSIQRREAPRMTKRLCYSRLLLKFLAGTLEAMK